MHASLVPIDGTYGILGRAGPTVIRTDGSLPVQGIMEFDVADAQNFLDQGLWGDIVVHEMLPAVGVGSMWGYMGRTSGSGAGGNLHFAGETATATYNTEFTDIAALDANSWAGVPIETDGGGGTAGGHWHEELVQNELMTGDINGADYLSEMTIASMKDMGYDTVLDIPNDLLDLYGTMPTDPVFDMIG